MIYVSQGHQDSIALEVFFKSIFHLSKNSAEQITLVSTESSLKKNISHLKLPIHFNNNSLLVGANKISLEIIDEKITPSTDSLNKCLTLIKKEDLLFTLPTSKDQLIFNEELTCGHTEFFRKKYNKESITMIFSSPKKNLVLITDHISVSNISEKIKKDLIIKKISEVINSDFKTKNFVFSGLNPHCGEDGLMGNEESEIKSAIQELAQSNKDIKFFGPIAGDAMHNFHEINSTHVYMYHDQGLAPFKYENRFIGANISIGLPFLRISPDHGTGFDLYGKNSANYYGCLYALKLAVKYHERNHCH